MKNARIIYNRLLKLYPRGYRQAFGAEMMQTFSDNYNDILKSKGRVSMSFWLSTITDEIENVVRQHRKALTEGSRFPGVIVSKLAVSAVLFISLYAVFYVSLVKAVLAVPHPHVSGIGVVMAMAALFLMPGLFSAAASYGLANAFASMYLKHEVKGA